MRYFGFVAYRGIRYCGWQRQDNGITVQEVIEESFRKAFNKDIKIFGSSRTDAGVSAFRNCFHFNIDFNISPEKIKEIINRILPEDIALVEIRKVKDEASARFWAKKRTYKYFLCKEKNVMDIGVWFQQLDSLDIEKMNIVAKKMIGMRSFESFSRKMENEKHDYECEVFEAYWRKEKNGEKAVFEISASRFLRGMVRSIVKNMIFVGCGVLTVGDFFVKLESKNRKENSGLMEAEGLVLLDVEYDNDTFV